MRTLWTIVSFSFLWISLVWAEDLEKIQNYFQDCNYDRAYKSLKKFLRQNPSDLNAQYLNIRLSLLTGEYQKLQKHLEELKTVYPDDVTIQSALGELYILQGQYESAEPQLQQNLTKHPNHLKTRYLLASMASLQGKENALEQMRFFVDHWNQSEEQIKTAEDFYYTGLGLWDYCRMTDRMDRYQVATQLVQKVFPKAVKLDPYIGALAQAKRAEIWLEYFDVPNAKKEALHPLLGHSRDYDKKGNPKDHYQKPHPDGFVLLGIAFAQDGNSTKMEHFMEEALKYNPNHVDALSFLAQLRISDERYEDAQTKLKQVLKINPRSLYALSLQASLYYLQGNLAQFEQAKNQVLTLNPKYGEFYLTWSYCLESKRQFEKIVEVLKEALKLNPHLAQVYRELGVSLMRIGHEEEALRALRKFREFNDTDPMSWNMLNLFEKMESFVTVDMGHFILKMDVAEKGVMLPYLKPLMEEAYEVLQKKYDFKVEGPVLLEVFEKHDDFAVRTVGFGGLGATGACFGKLVTVDSPKARKPGDFNWVSTTWHEFAHVITLQLSNYQVPRWFTEGLSEYEEFCRNPSWSRDYELEFYAYWSKGQMRGMETFNEGFRVPWEIGLCYYQGGLMCRYIADTYGFPKIIAMLKDYGLGKTTKEVIPEILGVDYKAFDQGFETWLKENVFKNIKVLPYFSFEQLEDLKDKIEDEPHNLDVLANICIGYFQNKNIVDAEINGGLLLQQKPNHPEVLSVLGRIMIEKGRTKSAKTYLEKAVQAGLDEFFNHLALAQIYQTENQLQLAIQSFQNAKKCFPKYVGQSNPYLSLAKIYEQQNNISAMLQELEEYCRIQGSDLNARIRMAKEYQQLNNHDRAIFLLKEVNDIFPYQVPSHTLLAKSFQAKKQYQEAIEELKVAIELKPEEGLSVIHTDLADIYLQVSQSDEARIHLTEALKLDPNNSRAKTLLDNLDK